MKIRLRNSGINDFRKCPWAFKLKYVDQYSTGLESIEAYTGTQAHSAMQDFYDLIKDSGRVQTLQEVVQNYINYFQDNWHTGLFMVKDLTTEFYQQLGVQCIQNYYLTYAPFNQGKVIATELNLKNNIGGVPFEGTIDRVDLDPCGSLSIHDYKTGKRTPTKAELETSQQLSTYCILLAKHYGGKQGIWNGKEIKLHLHYMQHNKTYSTSRHPDQLFELIEQIKNTSLLIHEANELEHWPARTSILCPWCEYKNECKSFLEQEERNKVV